MEVLPTALPQRPPPPSGLDAVGKQRWAAIVGERPVEFFSASDLPLLEELIRTEQIVDKCNKIIATKGPIIKGARGVQPVKNPAVAVRKEHVKLALDIQTKLRLCPSTRRRADDAGLGKRTGRGTAKKPWEA